MCPSDSSDVPTETVPAPARKFLTGLEVRRRWGVSASHLARLVGRGELVGVRFGRAVRFPETEVDAYVARLPRTAG